MPLTAGQQRIYTMQPYSTMTDSGQVIDSTSVLGALLANYLHVTLFEDEIIQNIVSFAFTPTTSHTGYENE